MVAPGQHCCDEHGTPSKHRAVILFLVFNGQVLAIRDDRQGIDDYKLPGGKVDPGETDAEAIVREVFEETGADITDPMPVYVHASYADTGRYVTTFVANLISDPYEIKGNGREGEPEWVPIEYLVEIQCTYRQYNNALLAHLGFSL